MRDDELPALFLSADDLSNRAQSEYLWALRLNLSFLVCSAILSIWNPEFALGAVAQAVSLACGLACTVWLATRRQERIWYGARAIAESVKTSAWRFMMRAEPYEGLRLEEATAKLRETLKLVIDQNKETAQHLAILPDKFHITAEMGKVYRQSWEERREKYLADRVHNQLIWYAKKSAWNKKRGKLFFSILIFFNGSALLAAVLRVAFPLATYWPTDALAACAAAVLAWIQVKRFGELAMSYNLAAHEIGMIREQISEIKQEGTFVRFVGDAENAFSREHTQWAARRDA
jgi:hypothetical protein